MRLVKNWFFLDTAKYSYCSAETIAGEADEYIRKKAGQLFLWLFLLGFHMPLMAAPASVDVGVEATYSDNLSKIEDNMDNPIEAVHSHVSAALHKKVVLLEKFSMMGRIGVGYHQYHID